MSYLKNPKGHIVFDCDGTLISSFEAILEGIGEVMSLILNREVGREEVLEKYESDLLALAHNFGLNPDEDEDLKKKLIKTWEEVAHKANVEKRHQFRLFPEIKELIKDLSKDYQLYVWTARDRKSTLHILKDLGVASFFLEFRCVDDCAPKPLTEGLEQMVGDIDKSKIIVIGDSPTDIRGAKNFGVKSIAACWADETFYQACERYQPEFKAMRPKDCLSIINGLF